MLITEPPGTLNGMAEVQLADVLALVRTLEANQAALIQRVEQLEHCAGVARYARGVHERAVQRRIGDYCPDVPVWRPPTIDPVEHALFNQALMLARREDF